MKDEIETLKMGTGNTVCSEANTGMGLGLPLLGNHHFHRGGMKLSFPKVGSQIFKV